MLHRICQFYCGNPLFYKYFRSSTIPWVSVNISISSFLPSTSFNYFTTLSASHIYTSNFFPLLKYNIPLPLLPPHPSTTDYRLVIICSDEDEDKSHIISRLSIYRQHFSALHNVAMYREYLKTHFTFVLPTHQSAKVKQQVAASLVDCEKWVLSSYYIHIPDFNTSLHTYMHTQFPCKGSQLH